MLVWRSLARCLVSQFPSLSLATRVFLSSFRFACLWLSLSFCSPLESCELRREWEKSKLVRHSFSELQLFLVTNLGFEREKQHIRSDVSHPLPSCDTNNPLLQDGKPGDEFVSSSARSTTVFSGNKPEVCSVDHPLLLSSKGRPSTFQIAIILFSVLLVVQSVPQFDHSSSRKSSDQTPCPLCANSYPGLPSPRLVSASIWSTAIDLDILSIGESNHFIACSQS
ncbi:hypothetical protein QBC36DRAFT_30409 [Triangularia setosa]|uniref:Uncharacterized protein n=1 Tax=Triangularia setosa TaxID=2587417 RepID=A0AAN6WHT8_9PEZI|nr:hypothetical protein QBC36DRAFT_30409 [Podospora setosa]